MDTKAEKQKKSEYFEGVNGSQLYYRVWKPDGAAKAVLVIVHGVGEHIDRYKNFTNVLPGHGYAVFGFDLRGHGRSDGKRGHIQSWEEYRGDLRNFFKLVYDQAPDLPVFLFGHSLGSLIALDYLLRYPEGLKGAIISGNALLPTEAAPPMLKMIAKALSGISPAFTMKVTLKGDSLSRNPEEAQAYEKDPMVHWQRTARWGTECLQEIEWIDCRASEIKIPMLFVHGGCDPLVSVEGTRDYFERISFPDKTLYVYPDCLHEPHNDLEYQKEISDILGWMDVHLK